jgi:hypothetical protein
MTQPAPDLNYTDMTVSSEFPTAVPADSHIPPSAAALTSNIAPPPASPSTPFTVARKIVLPNSPFPHLRTSSEKGSLILQQLHDLESNQKLTERNLQTHLFNQTIDIGTVVNTLKLTLNENLSSMYQILASLVEQQKVQSACIDFNNRELHSNWDTLSEATNEIAIFIINAQKSQETLNDNIHRLGNGVSEMENILRKDFTIIKEELQAQEDKMKQMTAQLDEKVHERILLSDSHVDRNFVHKDDLDRIDRNLRLLFDKFEWLSNTRRTQGLQDQSHLELLRKIDNQNQDIIRLQDEARKLVDENITHKSFGQLMQRQVDDLKLPVNLLREKVDSTEIRFSLPQRTQTPLITSNQGIDFMSHTILSRLDRLETETRQASNYPRDQSPITYQVPSRAQTRLHTHNRFDHFSPIDAPPIPLEET